MSSSNLDRHLRSTGNCAPRQVPTQIIELAKKWNIPLSATEKVACETTVVRTRLGNKSVTFLSHDNDDSIPRFLSEILAEDNYNVARMYNTYAPFVVDIGANLGAFSIYSAISNPTATIISIEPNPITYMFFYWNLLVNEVPIITTLNDENGKRNFGVMPIHSAATNDGREVTVEYNLLKSQNTITSASSQSGVLPTYDLHVPGGFVRKQIPSVSIDALLERNKVHEISFLKIDCEGCEYEVLPSLKHLVNQNTFFAGELHACRTGHSCAFSAELISETKQFICNSFQECCLTKSSFGAVTCGGMSRGKTVLGSHPYRTMSEVLTGGDFLVTSIIILMGVLIGALLLKMKKRVMK